MKRKILIYSTAAVIIGLGALGVSIASAHGLFGGFGLGSTATPEQITTNQTTMFQNEATILGVSVDEVKAAWAQGKSFSQLAQDKGITQAQLQTKLKDFSLQQHKTQLSTLVTQGVITQAQADQRLQFIQTQTQSNNGKMMGRGMPASPSLGGHMGWGL